MKSFFIHSDSYNKINTKVEEIVGKSLNVIKYDLRISSIEDALVEANYFSLTGEDKYLIIRCDDIFKSKTDKEVKLLEDYFNHPNDKCILIFTCMGDMDKRKKIYKLFDKNLEMVIYPILNKKDMVYECMNILKKKGYVINYETGNYIVENSYNNYDIMLNELNKVYTLIKPGLINVKDIEDVISKSITNTTYAYVDALIKGDISLASKLSSNFERLKIEPTVVLVMLAKEFDILFMLKSGISLDEIQTMYKKEPWQMKSYYEKSSYYTLNEIKKIIIKLNDYDYKIKSGKLDRAFLVDLLTFELC